jgi:effector-binding domain-containing protein
MIRGVIPVTVTTMAARPTAVVRRTTSWHEFPSVWRELLDEVYAYLDAAGLRATQRWNNVMLYEDDAPTVEVGVLIDSPFSGSGRVVASQLPAGEVATAVHRGRYDRLGAAHDAVTQFCRERGLELAGPRWEIYGHHNDDPEQLETSVHYLLRQGSVIHSP